MLDIVRKRDEKKGKTSSEEDYGFYYPVALVERCFWERYNANGTVYPEPGGMLDQDEQLMADLGTYAWLVGFARNILAEEAEALKGNKR